MKSNNPYLERLLFLIRPIGEFISRPRVRGNAYYLRQVKKLSVKENQVLLESYHAVSLTGNVYAIFTEMIKQKPEYKYFWAYGNDEDPMIEKIKTEFPNSNINFIKYESKKYYRELAESKYLINDTSFMPYFIKRKEQVYTNTWHGTPLKTLGLDIKDAGWSDHKNIQKNLLSADKIIMPNKFTADKLISSHDLNGILPAKVVIAGNARVDLTLKPGIDVRSKYELPNKKIVLFAPTWKKSIKDTTKEDINELVRDLKKLQESVSSDYVVLLKSHYFVYDLFVEFGFQDYILPNWVDTNELLSAVDVLITDYSSIFFDFLPLKKPVIFFIPDKEAYADARGFYIDLDTLPGAVTETLKGVSDELSKVNNEYCNQYKQKYDDFSKKFLYMDDGKSRERAVDFILDRDISDMEILSFNSNKKKILMYAGGFYNNGITISAINLSNHIDYDKYELIFWDFSKMTKAKSKNISRLNQNVHFIYEYSYKARTFFDTYNQNWIYRQGINSPFASKNMFFRQVQFEMKRIMGDLEPDVAIDFGGYNKMFTALIASSDIKFKSIYLHNAMLEEYNKKIDNKFKHKWNLKVIFSFYNYFDRIISVSESVNDQNKSELSSWISDKAKMKFVNNLVDGDGIISQVEDLKNQLEISRTWDFDGSKRIVFNREVNDNGILTENSFIKPNADNINFVNVARLSPEKNQISLIQAFYQVNKQNSNTRLFIVGDGPEKERLQNEINSLGLKSVVKLMGYISKPAMLVKLCDCFVLSSNYEGQGLSLIEAMVMGKPVIGTDVAGITSVLQNTDGLLVPNTIDGIKNGMLDFINGKINAESFDYEKYNQEAINQFYSRTLE